MSDIKYYIQFPGFDHGGHTLVGAILDSHPNVCMYQGSPPGFNTPEELIDARNQKTNFFTKPKGHLYEYTLDGQGTGKDYVAVGHTNCIHRGPTFGLEVKQIVTVRHPRWVVAARWRKIVNRIECNNHMGEAVRHVETILKALKDEEYFLMVHEDWTKPENQKPTLIGLCRYLGIDYIEEWADRAVKIIDPKPSRSHGAKWTEQEVSNIERLIRCYTPLEYYR